MGLVTSWALCQAFLFLLLPVLHHLMLDLDLFATCVFSLFPEHPIQYLLLWVLRSGRGSDVM